MKTKSIITTSWLHDPDLEDAIQKKGNELKESAIRDAKHFAKRNLPAVVGDDLSHYLGESKTGCEKLAAYAFQRQQPAAHFPEAKMEHETFKEKEDALDAEINSKEHQNQNDEYELGNFNPASMATRIKWAAISTLIIMAGEIVFNTKAFEVTGEDMLFALVLSISVSFTVSVFSHVAPFVYKAARNTFQRRLVVICSLLLATGIFTALAIFRSRYLASHEVDINPSYFVVINLFFFIVSALLSLFILPTIAELREHAHRLKLYQIICRRKKEIQNLKEQSMALKEAHLENTKQRVRQVHYANYIADTIRKMHWENAAIFKSTNLACRSDGRTPDCFSQNLPEPNIDDVTFNLIGNRK